MIPLARRLIDVACVVMARFANGSLGRFEFEHPYTWTTGESRA